MTMIAVIILGQMIQFHSEAGYAECVGTPEQVIQFYETWKHYSDPTCKTTNKAFWEKYDRNVYSLPSKYSRLPEMMMFTADRHTRTALAKAIFYHGLTVRFRVRIDPFGSFWVYYNPWWHVAATIVFLMGLIWWLKRRIRREQ